MRVAEAIARLERLGLAFELDAGGYPHLVEVSECTEQIPGDLLEFLEKKSGEVVALLRKRAATQRWKEAEYATILDAASKSCAAMTASCPGMMQWLRREHSALHDDISRRLPDFASRLWDAHAPIEEFRRAVVDIKRATSRAVSLFLACSLRSGSD